MSLRQTAQQVLLHHTTVQYRLKRIEQRARHRAAGSGGSPADADRDPALPDRAGGRGHRDLTEAAPCTSRTRRPSSSLGMEPVSRRTSTFRGDRVASRPWSPERHTARRATSCGFRPSGGCSRTTAWHSWPRTRAAITASEGELAPFVEASDGWDTFEWITSQPWSDGSIAVFGESYVGFTAIAAAATAHPSLRAAALRNTGTDIEGDWLRHQGVLRLEFVLRWAFAAWSGNDNLAPEFDWTRRPLDQIAQALSPIVGPDRLPAVLDGWATEDKAVDGTRRGDPFPSLIDRVRVPTHVTTGWWDLFVRGATRDWARLASRPGVDSRLVAEPTDHAGHDWGDGPTPDPLADFEALADQDARGPRRASSPSCASTCSASTDGSPSPVSWMLTHAGVQQSPSWPPPDAAPMTLHLVDGGRASHGPEGGGLSSRPDRVPIDATWRHDPADPVPALEGEALTAGSVSPTSA